MCVSGNFVPRENQLQFRYSDRSVHLCVWCKIVQNFKPSYLLNFNDEFMTHRIQLNIYNQIAFLTRHICHNYVTEITVSRSYWVYKRRVEMVWVVNCGIYIFPLGKTTPRWGGENGSREITHLHTNSSVYTVYLQSIDPQEALKKKKKKLSLL